MKALVITPICPLMLHPSFQSERADEALLGMVVEVLEEANDGWLKVLTHYGYTGYAHVDDLLLGDDRVARWGGVPKAVVTRSLCDVLERPDIKSPVLLTVLRGNLLVPSDPVDEKGWQKVYLPDGRAGYTKHSFLGPYYEAPATLNETELRGRIVQSALSYMGTAYRWGGKTPMGIDCSGLTGMAYLLNGVIIWRDASMREGYPVHPIALADARPADLIYFPGHIAMYLGNGRYVHATARDGSDGVAINSLNPRSPEFRADLAQSITAVGSIF